MWSVFAQPENTVSLTQENGKDKSSVPIPNLRRLATSHGGVAGKWAQSECGGRPRVLKVSCTQEAGVRLVLKSPPAPQGPSLTL